MERLPDGPSSGDLGGGAEETPHLRMSMRMVAKTVGLSKTTVTERLTGRRRGRGRLLEATGGAESSRKVICGIKRATKRAISSGIGTCGPLDAAFFICLYFFISAEEAELADVILYYANRGFPFTPARLKALAYDLGKANGRTGFSPIKKKAGRYWLKAFLARHPNIRRKNSVNLSIARAMAANPVQISKWFSQLKGWYNLWGATYSPNNIWNVDECGIPDVPKEVEVLGETGKRAFQTVSGEKATNTTFLTFVSAGGLITNPMLIIKAARVQQQWRDFLPPGWMLRANESGYIEQELFAQFGQTLIDFLSAKGLLFPPGSTRRNILLLDQHKSHLFNLTFMRLMQANNVEVCSFPPHCTHLLQPLDDLPFASFKNFYNQALLELNYRLGGKKMSREQFFSILIPSYQAAMTPVAVQKGFANCGIYPLNPAADKLQKEPSAIYDKCECVC